MPWITLTPVTVADSLDISPTTVLVMEIDRAQRLDGAVDAGHFEVHPAGNVERRSDIVDCLQEP
jgi:hypothetical protein